MKAAACSRQHGAAALGVALILLAIMTLMALYSSRSLVFEQRASANQYRAARAQEAAEAGLEWGMAMLNEPRRVDAACRAAAIGNQTFRERYAPLAPAPTAGPAAIALAPVTAARPGCRLIAGGLTCDCPASGAAAGLQGDEPGFSLEFAALTDDAESIRVVSRGCSSGAWPCLSGSASADAVVVLAVTLKLRPGLRSPPTAALTAGGNASLDAMLALRNLDRDARGLLIDAGGEIGGAAATLTTLPGSPAVTALVDHDPALTGLASADASGDALFAAVLGAPPAAFAAAPVVKALIGCAPACGDALRVAAGQGHATFLVDAPLQLDAADWPNGEVGSATRPLLVVATGAVSVASGTRVHGLIYGHVAPWRIGGAGSVRGAVMGRGSVQAGDGLAVEHASETLHALRYLAGVFARLPGSWRDGRCLDADPAMPCRFAP